MPAIVVAVAAVAAGAAASAAFGAAVAGTAFAALAGGWVASTVGILVGAVAAAGVSYAASSILGLNRRPSASASARPDTRQDRRQMIRGAVEARQVVYGRARVSGPMLYASSSGDDRRFLHLVVALAGHPVAGFDAVWINDHRLRPQDINFDGFVNLDPLRARARVRFYDGTQTAADPDLVAESADGWSPQHILRGIAYLYVRLEYDQDAFPNGLQNIGAEIRGKSNVLDPRTSTTGYTENAALIVLDYLRSADGLACAADEIDTDAFIAAANVCDEAVQITAAAATQPRYHAGGAFTLDAQPIRVMDTMLAACAGTLVYVQGRYRLIPGAYAAPTDILTVSDLAGPIELQTRPPRRELFNAVRGTFIDPGRNWQSAEFPPVTDAAFVAEDGESIARDIDLPFVNDGIRAQRLSRLLLRRARETLTLRVPVRYAGIRYGVWQMLSVTLPDFGFDAKPFRVTAWTFDPGSGLVTLTLQEEGAGSYAWTFDQAASLGQAPNTALVDPFSIPAPAGLTLTEQLYVTADGAGVRNRAVLSWLPPAYPFITGYDWRVRRADSADWTRIGGAPAGARAEIDDLPDALHVFQVRARSLVASGAWAELQANIGALAAQPPADLTGLSVQSIGGFAFLRWDKHPDLDVRVGGRIEFRHTPDTVSPTWVGSTGIGEAQPGDSTFAVLPLKAGTYLAKAVDQGGRYSATAASIGAAQATALSFAAVSTLTEHPGFSGAKTGTLVLSSTLRLDSGGDVDGAPDWDAIPDLDSLGGVRASGSYAFSGGMDLTTVRPVRLTGRIAATVVNTLDQVDARVGLVDDWLDWDGAVGGEADAWIEVRQTDDNPGGTPTWSAWQRLDQSEFRARAFQFRAQLRSYDLAFNIDLTALSVTADEVV